MKELEGIVEMEICRMKENALEYRYGEIKLVKLALVYVLAIACAIFLRVQSGVPAVFLSGIGFYILPILWMFWELKKGDIPFRLWAAPIKKSACSDTFFAAILFIGISMLVLLIEAMLFQEGELTYEKSEWQRILVLAALAPIVEECICRGVILQSFLCKYSVKKAVWLSALLFYLIHFNVFNVLTIAAGVVFAVLMAKHCCLYLTITVHFFWNLMLQLKPWIIELLHTAGNQICSVLLLLSVLAIVSGLVKSLRLYRSAVNEAY